MQRQINVDVEELQNLLAEIKESMERIKKLRSQQKLIKKEITVVNRTIRRVKDNGSLVNCIFDEPN